VTVVRSSRRTLVVILLAALMALFHLASSANAAELCFGVDGHVAIEGDDTLHRPAGLFSPSAESRVKRDSAARDHGDCLDVIEVASHNSGLIAKVVPVPAANAASASAMDEAIARIGIVEFEGAASMPALACLRSTVLRV
jgi:hypothetical protein